MKITHLHAIEEFVPLEDLVWDSLALERGLDGAGQSIESYCGVNVWESVQFRG